MTRHTYEKEITALLVVDPYNDFISEGGKLWGRVRAAASAICRPLFTPNSALPACNGMERCGIWGLRAPIPVLHRARWAQMHRRLYSSADEGRGSGQLCKPQ